MSEDSTKDNFLKTIGLMIKSSDIDEDMKVNFNKIINSATKMATDEEIKETEFYINEIIKSKQQKEKSIFD